MDSPVSRGVRIRARPGSRYAAALANRGSGSWTSIPRALMWCLRKALCSATTMIETTSNRTGMLFEYSGWSAIQQIAWFSRLLRFATLLGSLGKLIPYPIFRDLNYPSDLAVLKTNTVILANVLDEILEKRLVFQPTNNSTLKHESRQNGDFRHVISGAGDENRTRVRCLGSIGNNHYTTPALANHYNSAAVHPTGQFNETPRVSA